MAGKMTAGVPTNSKEDFRRCKAYAEGVEARVAATAPVNPHPSGTPEFTSWATGVNDVLSADVDGCVASPGRAAAT